MANKAISELEEYTGALTGKEILIISNEDEEGLLVSQKYNMKTFRDEVSGSIYEQVSNDLSVLTSEVSSEVSSLIGEVSSEICALTLEVSSEVSSLTLQISSEVSTLTSEMSSEMSSLTLEVSSEVSSLTSQVSSSLSTALSVLENATSALSGLSGNVSAFYNEVSTHVSAELSTFEGYVSNDVSTFVDTAVVPLKKIVGLSTLNYYTLIGDQTRLNEFLEEAQAKGVLSDAMSVIWFDTTDTDNYATENTINTVKNLQYQIYRLDTQMKDVYRMAETGIVPGKVINSHKQELITLVDKLELPEDLLSSDKLASINIYGQLQMQNKSRYYTMFSPAGFDYRGLSTHINWAFDGSDAGSLSTKTIFCVSADWTYNTDTSTWIETKLPASCYLKLELSAFDGQLSDAYPSALVYDIAMSAHVDTESGTTEYTTDQDIINEVITEISVHSARKYDKLDNVGLSIGTSFEDEDYGVIATEGTFDTTLLTSEAEADEYTLSICGDDSVDFAAYYWAILNETTVVNLPMNTNLHWFFLSSHILSSGEEEKVKVSSISVEVYDPDAEEGTEKYGQVDIVNSLDTVGLVTFTLGPDTTENDVAKSKVTLYVESKIDNSISASKDIQFCGKKPASNDIEPTVNAVCVKRDTSTNFSANRSSLYDGEILYYTDKQQFVVFDSSQTNPFITIGPGTSGSSGGGDVTKDQVKDLKLEYLTFQDQCLSTDLSSHQKTQYKIAIDTDGKVLTHLSSGITENISEVDPSTVGGNYVSHLLQIGKVYCGGAGSDHCQVSHNFVEITNADTRDINLDTIYLMYRTTDSDAAYKIVTEGDQWEYIKLNGVLPAGRTYIVRGDCCNSYNNTFFKIDSYDMQWHKKSSTDEDLDRTGALIKFSQEDSTFLLVAGKDNVLDIAKSTTNPYVKTSIHAGYVDMCGFGEEAYGEGSKQLQPPSTVDWNNILFIRNFLMDPSKQANKAYASRNTSTFWTYVDLTKQNRNQISQTQYYYSDILKKGMKPGTVAEKHTFFSNKTHFDETKPNMVNITFGIQATAKTHLVTETSSYVEYVKVPISSYSSTEINLSSYPSVDVETKDGSVVHLLSSQCTQIAASLLSANGNNNIIALSADNKSVEITKYVYDKKASRCFNWVSVGYFNEFLKYRLVKDAFGTAVESEWSDPVYSMTEDSTNVIDEKDWVKPFAQKIEGGTAGDIVNFYSRFRWTASDGTLVTTHKVILHEVLDAGEYEYYIGRDDDSNYKSKTYTFRVHADSQVANFTFLQTTDQQGFNWQEYQAWKASCWSINEYKAGANRDGFNFTLNTGDIAQSGNRVSEWMDYRDGRTYIEDKEEMFTIGNNDLCGRPDCELTNGEDTTSKFNLVNVLRYFTFELDPYNVDEDGHSNYYAKINGIDRPIYSLYSFTYGWWHFVSLVSEIRSYYSQVYDDITDTVAFSKAMNAQVEAWFLKDLMMFKDVEQLIKLNNACSNCLVYMHEMPFTITTSKAVNAYCESLRDPTKVSLDRSANAYSSIEIGEGAGCKLNIEANGFYRISRLFKKLGIRAILGGHKHTFAISKPIYDAPQDDSGNTIFPNDTLDLLNDPFMTVSCTLSATNMPVIEVPTGTEALIPTSLSSLSTDIGRYHDVEKFTAPMYIMSQATGFKLVSNKELPPPTHANDYPFIEQTSKKGYVQLPWLMSYYPAQSVTNLTSLTPYCMQYKPMFIEYKLDSTLSTISFCANQVVNVYQVTGKGSQTPFNINNQTFVYGISSMTISSDSELSDLFNPTSDTQLYSSMISGNIVTISCGQ